MKSLTSVTKTTNSVFHKVHDWLFTTIITHSHFYEEKTYCTFHTESQSTKIEWRNGLQPLTFTFCVCHYFLPRVIRNKQLGYESLVFYLKKIEQKNIVYFSTKVSLKLKKVATYSFVAMKRCSLTEFMSNSLFYIFPATPQNQLLSIIAFKPTPAENLLFIRLFPFHC